MKEINLYIIEKLKIDTDSKFDSYKFPLWIKFQGCGSYNECWESIEKLTDIKLTEKKLLRTSTSTIHLIRIYDPDKFIQFMFFLNYHYNKEKLTCPDREQLYKTCRFLTFTPNELKELIDNFITDQDIKKYWIEFKKRAEA